MKSKKITSVLVAAVLVLGLLPSVALANGSDDAGVGDTSCVTSSADVDSAASSSDVFENTHQASDVAGMATLESTPAPLATTTATGTMGTCTWTLAGGVLTIAPTDGVSGEFNGYSSYIRWPWYSSYKDSIASVKVEPGVSATGSLVGMFSECSSLVTVDFSNLDTSNVTDANQMFEYCYSLTSVDFSGFDFSLVANMSYMFSLCTSLKSVNFSGADLSSVINMSQMFYNCSSLESVDFSGVNSSLVTNMSSMFYYCTSLSYLDLSGFTTSSLTNMSSMFGSGSYYTCTALRTVIVSDGFVFNTALPTPTTTVTTDTGRTTTVSGWWVSDSGTVYDDPADIPSNVAATYTAAFTADTSELEAAIAAAELLNEADYTTASWANLQTALSSAKSVLANTSATQSDIGSALAVLNAAVTALVPVSGSTPDPTPDPDPEPDPNPDTGDDVNKAELEVAIGTAENLDSANYTADSWAKLQTALSTAQDVFADASATQAEVNAAANTLNNAIDDLVPLIKTMTVYAGDDRYATANLISSAVAQAGTYDGVIVASGANGKFADALCASGLSGVLGYPIVLVNGSVSTLDSATKDLVSTLVGGKGDIIILGGTSTVKSGIRSSLVRYDSDGEVTRISGDDRYATAQAIYEYGADNGSWSGNYAVLAKGNDFPDALGAASFCASYGVPMLLTDANSTSLSSYVTAAADYASKVVIVGGTESVSSSKETTLKRYATVERMAGNNRYETNISFAEWQLEYGMFIDGAGIATGTSFPDSLGSSYLLSLTKSVLLLASKTESDNAALYDLLAENADAVNNLSVLGGDASVPADTRKAIQSAIGGEWNTVNKS